MKARQALIGGAGLGAGLMYFFDPARGRRRRAWLGDELTHMAHRAAYATDVTSRDIAHRTRGIVAELSAHARDEYVTDKVLVARVRAELGLLVRHPHQVTVSADNRCVTLSGPVQADELYRLLVRVASVPGVAHVEDRLEMHGMDAADMPTEPLPPGELPDLFQDHWSPATRLLAGCLGGGLALGGALRRDALGAAVGLVLVGRALTGLSLARLTGIGAGRRAVDVQKTINIAAPVEQVFGLWGRYEQFPFIMDHVRDVELLGEDRSRWVVAGPLGWPVGWEAVITRLAPNELLAWMTTPESAVKHAGVIRFDPNPDGGTRVDIKLSYNPPGGAIGHALAILCGCDPKRAMDRDLVELKSLVEQGKTTAHHEEVKREELGIEPTTSVPAAAEVGR
jgi:uncharacterized membrane protein